MLEGWLRVSFKRKFTWKFVDQEKMCKVEKDDEAEKEGGIYRRGRCWC